MTEAKLGKQKQKKNNFSIEKKKMKKPSLKAIRTEQISQFGAARAAVFYSKMNW